MRNISYAPTRRHERPRQRAVTLPRIITVVSFTALVTLGGIYGLQRWQIAAGGIGAHGGSTIQRVLPTATLSRNTFPTDVTPQQPQERPAAPIAGGVVEHAGTTIGAVTVPRAANTHAPGSAASAGATLADVAPIAQGNAPEALAPETVVVPQPTAAPAGTGGASSAGSMIKKVGTAGRGAK